jgi:cyclic pyranopterin phosphate synthase
MAKFSHWDASGKARMVDISEKSFTARRAVASGRVRLNAATIAAIRARQLPKGDPFETARLAGILAAKQTAQLIPLCHSLLLSYLDVEITLDDQGAQVQATAATQAGTGVEMEALTAVSVAALTIYDMCKAVDKEIVITDIQLERKTGGKSGDWRRKAIDGDTSTED